MASRVQNEYIKHNFNDLERKEIANRMAQKVSELHQAEDDKKAIMSDFKSQIDGLTAEVNSSATKLNNGYEMRNVECEHTADYTQKVWIVTRRDNGEWVKDIPMTADDMQLNIDDNLSEQEDKAAENFEPVDKRVIESDDFEKPKFPEDIDL